MAERLSLKWEAESVRERLDSERLSPREAAALHARISATVEGNRAGLRIALAASGAIAALAVITVVVLRPPSPSQGRACIREHAGFIDIDPSCREPVALTRGKDVITAQAGAHLEEGPRGVRVRRGKVSFEVHKRVQGDSMRVAVSHGDIEVVGTRFTVQQRDGEGEVQLDEGSIVFHWADGQETRLTPGESLVWPRRGAPVTLKPIELSAPAPEVVGEDTKPAAATSKSTAAGSKPTKVLILPKAQVEQPRETAQTNASGAMSMEEVLKQMALLRSQHRYRDAVDLLAAQAARKDFSEVQRARLSFEMGLIMQDRLDDVAPSCGHWRDHLRKYPDDAVHADRIREYLQACPQ